MESSNDDCVGFIRYIVDESKGQGNTIDAIGKPSQFGHKSEQSHSDTESSGSETDLEEGAVYKDVESVDKSKTKLEALYKKACRTLGITPCSPFLRHICDEEIDLSHYNIGPLGAKAVARTLRENTTTIVLSIHDNGIGSVGAKAFAEMLADNCFLTVLDMSLNFIAEDGFEAISNVLRRNKYIAEVTLASTKLNNSAAILIGKMIEENSMLRSLDLSSNEIGDEGAIHIANGIKTNSSILILSLGSNHIRGKGITLIADALMYNTTLETIDLYNNGCADSGARAIGNALIVNQTLREIDISQNRITPDGAFALGIGLEENTGLTVLKLGGNPFQLRGAISIVDSLISNKETNIEELYFDDVVVSADFEKLLLELQDQREGLYVQFGTVIKGKEHRRRRKQQKDLISRILDYIELRGIRIVDFFRSMDKTGRLMISKAEFIKGLKTARIPIRQTQVDNLFSMLDADDNGFAQYKEFFEIIQRRTHEEFAMTRNNYQWNH